MAPSPLQRLQALLIEFPTLDAFPDEDSERLERARGFNSWRDRLHAVVQLNRQAFQPHARRLELLTQDLLFVPSSILHADAIDLRLVAQRLQDARERLNSILADLAPGGEAA